MALLVSPSFSKGGIMREDLDNILSMIAEPSLTNTEFFALTINVAGWNIETFNALLSVLTSRESVTLKRKELASLFRTMGVDLPADAVKGASNIFVGAVL